MKTHGKKLALVLAIVLMGSLLLVGCGGGGGGTSTGGGAASTATPASTATGGDDTSTATGGGDDGGAVEKKDHVEIELYAAPSVLDPQLSGSQHEWHINMNIYDNLFRARQQDWDRCEPWLVESYEISDDNCNWTLKLREGVKFHNGSELTADDVVFTIERARIKSVSAAGLATVTAVNKIDDYTVLIEQDRPYPILIETLCGPQFGIVNKALVEEYGEGAKEAIIGAGPYKMVEWSADNNVTLEYNEDFFMAEQEGVPDIKSATFRVITDANAATIAFDSGEIDIFWRNIQFGDFQRYRDDPNINCEDVMLASRRGLAMNNETEKFSDVRVRRAMSHAMDKEAINEITTEGESFADVWVKTDSRGEGYALAEERGWVTKYEYDPEQAKTLLAEAGYDENNQLSTSMICNSTTALTTLAGAIQDYMAQVGVVAEVEPMEVAQYMQRVSTGDFEAAASQWGFEYYWSPLVYLVHIHNGYYFAYEHQQNPRVDEICDTGYGTWDYDERNELYAELIQILTEDVICVPVYQTAGLYLSPKGLQLYYDSINMIAPIMWMEWTA